MADMSSKERKLARVLRFPRDTVGGTFQGRTIQGKSGSKAGRTETRQLI